MSRARCDAVTGCRYRASLRLVASGRQGGQHVEHTCRVHLSVTVMGLLIDHDRIVIMEV